jgi:diketogulonate reductase-like aldo/keto reductase
LIPPKSRRKATTSRYTKIPITHGSGEIPALGFGTLIPDPTDTIKATIAALEAGFRQLDSAERYRNEKEVGEAIQEVFQQGKIKREEVFIATKLWNSNHRPERVKPAFEASLKRLQLDYIDLLLIHTPFTFQPGDEQDPRDENGKVIYDQGVTLLDMPHRTKSYRLYETAFSLASFQAVNCQASAPWNAHHRR